MSGLYNLLFGENSFAKEILNMVGVEKVSLVRYRDAWIKNGEAIVYTRNGGGNREDKTIAFLMDVILPSHPLYILQGDDSYDNTYAYIKFKVPEEFKERAYEIEKLQTMTFEHSAEFTSVWSNDDYINNPKLTEQMEKLIIDLSSSKERINKIGR